MIRLIELFSGIGAQAKALERLGLEFEHYKTCDWEVNATKSYHVVHSNDDEDYSEFYEKEELADMLYELGVSNDGKKPMTLESIKRKGEKWLRDTYNAIKATNNLVDITKVHAKDLEIVDKFEEGQCADISFPNGYNKANRVHDECPAINLTTTKSSFVYKESQAPLRIRKLTPKECWRLMGFTDEDFEKAEPINSNSSLYKQAGNSIVVDVLMVIFKQLFGGKN